MSQTNSSTPQVATLPSSGTVQGTSGMSSVANTWVLDRTVSAWVGPIDIVTKDLTTGNVVTDVVVTFAVKLLRTRPVPSDLIAPVPSPDDSTLLGVEVAPVAAAGKYGIWAQGVRGSDIVLLDPTLVGYITRT